MIRLLPKGLMAAATIASVYVCSMAIAADGSEQFAGRWVAKQHKLTLDISPCGKGWCGVEVTDGTSCGRTVLRLDATDQGGEAVQFAGQLKLAEETQPYGVQVALRRSGEAMALTISGHTGGVFLLFRRTYDFHDVFARAGDPSCRPDSKVS